MPIFMDRHDVSAEVTAENVADLHQKDLKIQHKFNCKGLTYWFDDKRKTAFCLVEAPNKQSIIGMHNNAHGAIPHQIIEVDGTIVESFLGRIEDPEKSQKTTLNIINDPAFRTIMVAQIKSLNFLPDKAFKSETNNWVHAISEQICQYKGRIVKQKSEYTLASFDSVSDSVMCALEIQSGYNQNLANNKSSPIRVEIGISSGVPVTNKEGIFEDTIQLAERLCNHVTGKIVITSEVRELFESENMNIAVDDEKIKTLDLNDEKFLNLLLDHIEKEWNNPTLSVDGFSKGLGYSKSQLYRKLMAITGKSPNSFIKEYRLNESLRLLRKKDRNISEIAFETGFNSSAYFSKCFRNAFGILPSDFTKHN